MQPEDYEKLRAQLVLHEGRRRFPYPDTKGKLTIGVGYNVTDRGLDPLMRAIARTVTLPDLYAKGLTDEEIDRVLNADIATFERDIRGYLRRWEWLDPIRQRVCIDFVFNLGPKAFSFVNAIAALKAAINITGTTNKDLALKQAYFANCAGYMLHSLWASQVGDGEGGKRFDRADRLATMMRTGQDYTR